MATFFANRAIETAQAAQAAEAEEARYDGEFWFSSKKSEPAPAPATAGLSSTTQAILATLRQTREGGSKFKGTMATGGSRFGAHATLMNAFSDSFRQACATGEC